MCLMYGWMDGCAMLLLPPHLNMLAGTVNRTKQVTLATAAFCCRKRFTKHFLSLGIMML